MSKMSRTRGACDRACACPFAPPVPDHLQHSPWDVGYEFSAQTNVLPSPDELVAAWGLTYRQAALFGLGFLSRYRQFPPMFQQHAEWVYRVPDPEVERLIDAVRHGDATDEYGHLIPNQATKDETIRH